MDAKVTTARRVRDHDIHHASYRRKLKVRPKDAYKRPLGGTGVGQWIGYLKSDTSESWCAVWRDPDGKERQRWVGNASQMTYEDATLAVSAVLADVGRGVERNATVWQACAAYLTHFASQRRARGPKGERSIAQNEWKIRYYIEQHALAKVPLAKLRRHDLEEWKRGLITPTSGEATANRVLRSLKAVLNFALDHQLVGSDHAWRGFKAFPGAGAARQAFLTAEHRRAFLAACPPDLRDLCIGLFYTAARVGELRSAKVADFDAVRGTLRLVDYKGKQERGYRERFLPLNMFGPDVLAFFKQMAKDKLPAAHLFTRASGASWDETEHASNYLNNRFNHFKRRARALPKDETLWTKPLLAAAEARFPADAVPYSFRHTAISEWLSAGMLPSEVAYCAGTSITEIDKHYRKFIPSAVRGKLVNVKVV